MVKDKNRLENPKKVNALLNNGWNNQQNVDAIKEMKYWATRLSVLSFTRTAHSFAYSALLALLPRSTALHGAPRRSTAQSFAQALTLELVGQLNFVVQFSR